MWSQIGLYFVCLLALWKATGAEESRTTIEQAVNSFSVNLLKELSGDAPRNLIVSPVSVSTLLAILHQGARLNSSSQLSDVLQLSQEESKEGYGRLSRELQETRNITSVLEVANHLFVRQGFQLVQEFQQVAEQDFQSGIEEVTFGSGEGATAINNWVSQATHGRIPSIVEPVLSPSTVLVLTNAIFFKSPWLNRFNPYVTSNKTFSSRPGLDVSVPFMKHFNEWLKAGVDEDRDLKWVQLPFVDGGYSMVIVVPNQKYGLGSILRNFTGETLGQLLAAGSNRVVSLELPRFKLSSEIELNSPLHELGARDIFDQSASDLSGISSSSARLFVSKAVQKADIEVDEEGATAAAATVMQIVGLSALVPVDPISITADHPFLVALVDGTKRLPLFLATVVNPSS